MTPKKVSLFLLVPILLLSLSGSALAAEVSNFNQLNSSLAEYFVDAIEDNLWPSIWRAITTTYPELTDIGEPQDVHLDQKPSFTGPHAIQLTILAISDTENQLFVHFGTGWEVADDLVPDLILRWDPSKNSFTPIALSEDICYSQVVSVEPIMLDKETPALAITGFNGTAGRVGDFSIYRYINKHYERILHLPRNDARVIDYGPPARITDLDWISWDGYPVNTNQLDMASLSYTWESQIEFVWDATKEAFILANKIPSNFAIVNYFLKAIADNDLDNLTNLIDQDLAESADFPKTLDNLDVFLHENLVFLPFYQENYDYKPHKSDNIAVIGTFHGSDIWIRQNLKYVIVFELSDEESPKITHIKRIIFGPPELIEREYHVRPTMNFNKQRLEWCAELVGWETIYSTIQRKITLKDPPGEWFEIYAVLRSPAVIWTEAHYAAELRFETTEDAIENYENTVNELVIPITLEMIAFNEIALQEKSLGFVLSTDLGHHWQGTFHAGPLKKVSFLGTNIYGRVFHVEFDTRRNPIQWDLTKSATLHLIRQDKLERADITWDFGPLP
ncbi:MAG: hypothetical protein GX998_00025 [Firmicutes bacterium]|mgnify:CR=1 FL=1|nr:hypothetical protein [Bacillota bacterium]